MDTSLTPAMASSAPASSDSSTPQASLAPDTADRSTSIPTPGRSVSRDSRRKNLPYRRRRHSANDGLRPRSDYPFREQDSAVTGQGNDREDALSTLDEEPSRDPRDTSFPTPTSTIRSSAADNASDTASAFAGPDFQGLSWPSKGTKARLEATQEEAAIRYDRMVSSVRDFLECVGEDPDREGLRKTPERYTQAMLFFTKGYEQNLRDIVNGAIFNEDHDEMVIVKDIEVMSMCEHHLVPFTGKMHIGYIPRGRVLGLSKFARIAEMFARRFQVQERLTKQVAAAIDEVLQPAGVAVVVECSHLCMVMRGVQQTQSKTTTSCMLGALRSRDRTRSEFLTLIRQ